MCCGACNVIYQETRKLRARLLRSCQTDAELLLWQKLRNRQLLNTKFRRQHVIGRYIVDFVCLEKKLVIEIDGSQHIEQQLYDQQRTRYLVARGYEVIRFWNTEVLKELDSVLDVIYSRLVNPHPNPLPEREREQKRARS